MDKRCSALLILTLFGCAVPVAQQQNTLVSKTICCTSPRDFRYQSLATGKEETFKLNESAPVYDFGRTKTYFVAAKLDDGTSRILAIRSYFNGGMIGQYLQPIITFLDENYEPIVEVTPLLRFINLTILVNAHMGGAVPIPPNARCVIVSTGKFDGAQDIAQTNPGINAFMIGNTPVVTQSPGNSIVLTRSPTGEVWVKVLNQ